MKPFLPWAIVDTRREARFAALPAVAGCTIWLTLPQATLNNANDFAGKDIEIACSFARRDGSHVTDRRRVIPDTVNMKSRRSYAGMPVGFVNVNANKARCSVATASRV